MTLGGGGEEVSVWIRRRSGRSEEKASDLVSGSQYPWEKTSEERVIEVSTR